MPLVKPKRLRRLRKDRVIRDWVSQTRLALSDIISPYFVVPGKGVTRAIKSMPGISHLSVDSLIKDISRLQGIRSILLFGVSDEKDAFGQSSYKKTGIVQKAIKAAKKEFKDLIVMTDVCLCGYTSHGHCGIVRGKGQGARVKEVDNDATLEVLAKIALSHAEAGADFAAPSAMMDGQVGAIREALDGNGFKNTSVMAYSAKYSSSFYSPFRDALNSSPQFGDRKTYQMDYRNSDEALKEIKQDIDEGADIVMIKPALSYLDIIYRAKQAFNVPVAAYNVSGEYALVKGFCQGSGVKGQGSEIEREMALEILTSIKRAGADFIITYWAKDLAKWLK